MKASRMSHFGNVDYIQNLALSNVSMIDTGAKKYLEFISTMKNITSIKKEEYISVPDIYDKLQLDPFITMSKRNLYTKYKSGIVVGAGSGEDCIDLIDNINWMLFDLTDNRMIKSAIGYEVSTCKYNIVTSSEGDTVAPVDEKYITGHKNIKVLSIDSLDLKKCEIISVDAEGLGLDVLSGASKTIQKLKPDLLLSIYHNWIEYLLIIPFVYDLGYIITVVKTSNPIPYQPHLELTLLCKGINS